ncbi:MAG TPA: diguanylate cyclase, partial [Fimbriimonadaceae bacterium]|nr:diguanylate cyclase [Fimbriimonadaceae bacterium]
MRRLRRELRNAADAAAQVEAGTWENHKWASRDADIARLHESLASIAWSVKETAAKLQDLADSDPLTELRNHRSFHQRLQSEVSLSRAEDRELTLALLDIDHFTNFNLANGHSVGDEVLRLVAATLRQWAPRKATVARYGGEEFALILPGQDLSEAAVQLEALLRNVKATLKREGFEVTLSAGCAELTGATATPESLLLSAELALSNAKHLGRDRVSRFDRAQAALQDGSLQLDEFLEDGSLATIQALAAAVDAKDAYTQGHSLRVADYAAELVRRLGGSDAEAELVYRAGTLHDVGKIGVPDGILNKPGILSDEERTIMEAHPVLGEIIVKKVPQLSALLPGVRHHHERWNGTGYPDGLAGEEIPYMARVLALADTFDAMTSDRPYRKGM